MDSTGTLWIVSVLLTKQLRNGSVRTANSVSWRYGVTENEARGEALDTALRKNPGHSIQMVTVCSETRLAPK